MHLLSQIICSYKTPYLFRTGFPFIIRSSKQRIQQRYMSNSCCYLLLSGMRWNCSSISSPIAAAVWHIPLLFTLFWAPDEGRKDRPKHVERFTKINNLRWQVHLVGCTIGMYYDARTYEYYTLWLLMPISWNGSCGSLQLCTSHAFLTYSLYVIKPVHLSFWSYILYMKLHISHKVSYFT
jgi:hypothetical protein